MRRMAKGIALLFAPIAACSAEVPRFSGEGVQVEFLARSADGRYTLAADLHARAERQAGGRFDIAADLVASGPAKAATAACTPGLLFANGFE